MVGPTAYAEKQTPAMATRVEEKANFLPSSHDTTLCSPRGPAVQLWSCLMYASQLACRSSGLSVILVLLCSEEFSSKQTDEGTVGGGGLLVV